VACWRLVIVGFLIGPEFSPRDIRVSAPNSAFGSMVHVS
jgi:hypothetical protein